MLKSLYPVIMTNHILKWKQLFTEIFGFETTFVSDWYISLRLQEQEIAFMDTTHETIPEKFQRKAQGILVNIEVEQLDSLYQAIQSHYPLLLVQNIRDEEFGQRHFMMALDDVLIDVIQEIEPSDEFKQHYTAQKEAYYE